MCVDALEIGVYEHVGAAGGVGHGQPHPVENRLGDGAHVVGSYAHLFRLWNVESFEHDRLPSTLT